MKPKKKKNKYNGKKLCSIYRVRDTKYESYSLSFLNRREYYLILTKCRNDEQRWIGQKELFIKVIKIIIIFKYVFRYKISKLFM